MRWQRGIGLRASTHLELVGARAASTHACGAVGDDAAVRGAAGGRWQQGQSGAFTAVVLANPIWACVTTQVEGIPRAPCGPIWDARRGALQLLPFQPGHCTKGGSSPQRPRFLGVRAFSHSPLTREFAQRGDCDVGLRCRLSLQDRRSCVCGGGCQAGSRASGGGNPGGGQTSSSPRFTQPWYSSFKSWCQPRLTPPSPLHSSKAARSSVAVLGPGRTAILWVIWGRGELARPGRRSGSHAAPSGV